MTREEFIAAAQKDGYAEIIEREMPAGKHDPEHTHAFDARLLITEGTFTVTMNGTPGTYRPGDTFEVPAGTPHAEQVGETLLRYTVARRHHAAA